MLLFTIRNFSNNIHRYILGFNIYNFTHVFKGCIELMVKGTSCAFRDDSSRVSMTKSSSIILLVHFYTAVGHVAEQRLLSIVKTQRTSCPRGPTLRRTRSLTSGVDVRVFAGRPITSWWHLKVTQ